MTSQTGTYSIEEFTGLQTTMPRDRAEVIQRQIDYSKFLFEKARKQQESHVVLSILTLFSIMVVGVGILLYFTPKGDIEYAEYSTINEWVGMIFGLGFFATAIGSWYYSRLLRSRTIHAREDFQNAAKPFDEILNDFPKKVVDSVQSWMQRHPGQVIEDYKTEYVNGNPDGIRTYFAYSPSLIVFINFVQKNASVIFTKDIREVKLTNPGYQSKSTIRQTTESNAGNALKGAILGDFLVGDDWGAAGAVIGASGPRESVSQVSENVESLWSVDIYTRSQELTNFTREFGTNAVAAKKFYSVVSIAIDGQ